MNPFSNLPFAMPPYYMYQYYGQNQPYYNCLPNGFVNQHGRDQQFEQGQLRANRNSYQEIIKIE